MVVDKKTGIIFEFLVKCRIIVGKVFYCNTIRRKRFSLYYYFLTFRAIFLLIIQLCKSLTYISILLSCSLIFTLNN